MTLPGDQAPSTPSGLSIGQSDFWRRPVADRMTDFAALRESGPFLAVEMDRSECPDHNQQEAVDG
ncbi:MAG TPA: hypothetical protein VMU63_05605 [Acidimicrobiales bacterium]|nr:hypothetical protein [Acidimicrobiales bacterium]